MDKKQFLDNLKEDKWTDNPEELIQLRLPAVQFYLTHYVNSQYLINGHLFDAKSITIKYKDDDFAIVNFAYNALVKRYNKGELK